MEDVGSSTNPADWAARPGMVAMTMRTRTKDALYKASTGIHRSILRASKGRILGRVLGMQVIDLATVGRKSGKPRTTMLAVPIVESGRLVLVASFGGDSRHPAWYLNLRANPRVRVTAAGRTSTMVARTASPAERAVLWPRVTSICPHYRRYQERTDRPIPVVILEHE